MTLVPGDFLWCQCLVQYIVACYEKKSIHTLAAPATLTSFLSQYYIHYLAELLGIARDNKAPTARAYDTLHYPVKLHNLHQMSTYIISPPPGNFLMYEPSPWAPSHA